MKALSDALGEWAPSAHPSSHADPVAQLAAGWPEIVGDEIARNSMPVRLADETLSVATRSSSWSQELSFLADRIVAAVRARFPQTPVRQLRFKVGTISAPRGRPAAPAAAPPVRPPRGGAKPAPSATAAESLARFRAGVEADRRAKRASGWKECSSCGASIAPGDGSLCITCTNARTQRRTGQVARLLYEAPWLGYAATAALVDELTWGEYDEIRSILLSRWWDALTKAVQSKRLSRDGRERSIASSYVLLKSKLAPEEIRPATVRDVLGDELHQLIYGTETQT